MKLEVPNYLVEKLAQFSAENHVSVDAIISKYLDKDLGPQIDVDKLKEQVSDITTYSVQHYLDHHDVKRIDRNNLIRFYQLAIVQKLFESLLYFKYQTNSTDEKDQLQVALWKIYDLTENGLYHFFKDVLSNGDNRVFGYVRSDYQDDFDQLKAWRNDLAGLLSMDVLHNRDIRRYSKVLCELIHEC